MWKRLVCGVLASLLLISNDALLVLAEEYDADVGSTVEGDSMGSGESEVQGDGEKVIAESTSDFSYLNELYLEFGKFDLDYLSSWSDSGSELLGFISDGSELERYGVGEWLELMYGVESLSDKFDGFDIEKRKILFGKLKDCNYSDISIIEDKRVELESGLLRLVK